MLFAPPTFDLADPLIRFRPCPIRSRLDYIQPESKREPFRSVTHLVLTFQADAWTRTPNIRGQ
jgi:hypothetical protein